VRIILGVGGGIAAYKTVSLLRLLTEAGHTVTVVPTDAALKFVGAATWEALSGQPVSNSVFDGVDTVRHVRLGQEADLVIVAPATADLLARAAAGMADDLLTSTLLMFRGPLLLAPAMHTEMWQHAATQENVTTLKRRGATVLEPATGRLTGPDSGPGRMPEAAEIFEAARALCELAASSTAGVPAPVAAQGLLKGKTVTVTAGGTREPLDPVRYLGNRSSGKQGVALARAALEAGARVRLIAAYLEAAPPTGVEVVNVGTAAELRTAVQGAVADSDVLVMAAAVADFRPAVTSGNKIKKRTDGVDPVIELVRNPDILRETTSQRQQTGRPTVVVGFAAETGDAEADALEHARQKLVHKGCELLVLNRVGENLVFGLDETEAVILAADGTAPELVSGSKTALAQAVVGRAAQLLNQP
jgi:phosphopantothenoylcysteine decarboxylase/phosphopantothenate--cysteine ligase